MNHKFLIITMTIFSPLIAMASPIFVISTSSIDPAYKSSLLKGSSFDSHNSKSNNTLTPYQYEQSVIKQRDLNLAYANRVTNARQAGQMVKSRYGGRVLSINTSNSGNGKGYRVKLVDKNGKVLTIFVDAASGRMTQL
jgi:hypothetical protein